LTNKIGYLYLNPFKVKFEYFFPSNNFTTDLKPEIFLNDQSLMSFETGEVELRETINSITRDLVTLDALPDIPSLRQNYQDIITGNIKKASESVN
jgi:hypothetical protein